MSRGRVLITGASSGIGASLARVFAEEGFDLILTARREANLAALQSELSQVDVAILPADIATTDGVTGLLADIDDQFDQIDIVVNNAGMMVESAFDELSEPDLLNTLNLNVVALTRVTHHFAKRMRAQGQGRILNVASVAAFHPVPGLDLYAATKAFVLSLSESLAENLRSDGITVTTLCPGLTETEMMDPGIAAVLPPFMKSTPDAVAREGFDALMAREALRIPGPANRVALTWAQHQPRWLLRGLGGLAARLTPRS